MASSKGKLHVSMQDLSLGKKKPSGTTGPPKTKAPVVESWEDANDDDSGEETDRPVTPQASNNDCPSAPPPTPISPSVAGGQDPFGSVHDPGSTYVHPLGYTDGVGATKPAAAGRWMGGARPDKTDATARRMIAGALGVRPPKRTEEQKEYDRATKEKELRRREQERIAASQARHEAEKAKASIWAD